MKFPANEEIVQNVDRIFVFPEELRALRDSLKRYFQGDLPGDALRRPVRLPRLLLLVRRPAGQADRAGHARAPRRALGPRGSSRTSSSIFKRSRAFFIKDFYEKKVFPEQGLIAKTRAATEREKKTTLVFRILTWALLPLIIVTMIPAFLSLRRILNPIRTHAAQAQACMKQPCTIAQKYELTRLLYEDRVELGRHPFLLGLFLRGAKSNEIHTLLATVQQKLFFDGVVRPLLKEVRGADGRLELGDLLGLPVVLRRSSELPRVARIRPVPQEGGRHGRLPRGRPPPPRPRQLRPEDEGDRGGAQFAAEIDEWARSGHAERTRGQIRSRPARPRADAGDLRVAVPDPSRPIDTFERYWTVANLARWDWKLMKGLEEWVRLYTALTGIVDPQQASYLKRTADTAKPFKANFEALSKHLETPRPGEKGFPGANVEQWQRYLNESYAQLLTVGPPAAPAAVHPPRPPRRRRRRHRAAASPGASPALASRRHDCPDLPPGGTDARQHLAAPGADRAPPGGLRESGRARRAASPFSSTRRRRPERRSWRTATILVSGLLSDVGALCRPRCLPGDRRRKDPDPGEHDLVPGRQETETRGVAEAAGGPEKRVPSRRRWISRRPFRTVASAGAKWVL